MRVPRSSRPLAVLAEPTERAASWALWALGAFVISAAGAGVLAFRLYQTVDVSWIDALVALVFVVVAHQAVHALGLRAVGRRPRARWGFRGPVPHFHVGSASRLKRDAGLVATLMPVVVVGAAGVGLLMLPPTSGVGLAVVVANTVGSVPDLWRAARLFQLPRWVECELRGPAMLIWAPPEQDGLAVRTRLTQPAPPPPLVGVLGTWALCLLVAEAVSAAAVRLAAQWHGALSVGGVLLASTQQFISGPHVILNLWPVAAAGAALGTLAAAAWLAVTQIGPRAGRQTPPPQRVILRQS